MIDPRVRRRGLALITTVSAVALGLALPRPAAAAIAVEGYVYANQPAAVSYYPATGYEYNSAGQPIEVTHTLTGFYRVRFAGMATTGGVAHASAYGAGNSNFCTVSWGTHEADLLITVRCFDGAGHHVDTPFVAHFTNRQPAAGEFAYLLAGRPTSGGYQPAAATSYDSTGAPITVYRLAKGRYQVDLGALSQTVAVDPTAYLDGFFRATAFTTKPVRCEVFDAGLLNPPMVPVRCYDIFGGAVDERFTLTYAHGTSMLGTTAPYANATSNPLGIVGYTNAGGQPSIASIGFGRYEVTFSGPVAAGGHAMASAFDSETAYCNIASWHHTTSATKVRVDCFHAATHTPTAVYPLHVGFVG